MGPGRCSGSVFLDFVLDAGDSSPRLDFVWHERPAKSASAEPLCPAVDSSRPPPGFGKVSYRAIYRGDDWLSPWRSPIRFRYV